MKQAESSREVASLKNEGNTCLRADFERRICAVRRDISISVCVCPRVCGHVSSRSASSHSDTTFSPRGNLALQAKIKTPLSSPFHPIQPSQAFISPFFFSSGCLLSLSAFPSPLGTRQRFALITELLFTPVEKDRDTHQTTTPAYCYAPSTPALAFVHIFLCVCVCMNICLCFIFMKHYASSKVTPYRRYNAEHRCGGKC